MEILLVTHHRRSKMYNRPFPIAVQLARRGHHVRFVMVSDTARLHSERWNEDGVECIALPDLLWGRARSGWDVLVGGSRLWSILGERQFDLVYLFETRPSLILPVLVRRLLGWRIPLVMDWNDWWGGETGIIAEQRPRWWRWTLGHVEAFFETHFRTMATETTAICEPLRQRALALGVAPEHATLVRGGTRARQLPLRDRSEARERVGLGDGPLLAFASLDSHLDSGIMLAALSRVRATHPGTRLVVTGAPSEALREAAEAAGLGDAVVFTGFVPLDQMYDTVAACDVGLIPLADKQYNWGRWPNKFLDYITMGVPVVLNDIGDIARYAREADCGLIAEWDADDFARQITRLLDDRELNARLAANGRRLAEGELAWEHQVDVLEEALQRALRA